MKGYVYVLQNPAFPHLLKIGMSKEGESRHRRLSGTNLPFDFERIIVKAVDDHASVERSLHRLFGRFRVNKSREFFEITVDEAKEAISLVPGRVVFPKEEELSQSPVRDNLPSGRTIRSPATFERYQVPMGSVLHHWLDQSITAIVVGPRQIEFKGEIVSMSAAHAIIATRFGKKRANGARFWMYDGECLWDRRLRIERDG